ncbi:DNA polymerase III, delta' subunit domain protein [Aedoeadaptatus nemausensis]|uniref:DNA polymerase III subunit delta' n=1 Tax=Aedoeadaptatus nemausensis TaxID=2582829 RepID=A0A6V6Y3K8_9FIRM|nr:hypothetical protein [Peptoniphilus nemausensis]CAC9930408.1 DNA polymerase III, delta' subunit domain protein [Peptoniphilus nemausensis]
MSLRTKEILRSSLHGFIVKGEGEAALSFAREYGKGFLCTGDDAPCGSCPSCRLFESGEGKGSNHPDYIEVFPTKKTSKASIKKESIEEVIDEAAMTSYLENGKLFVFQGFDTATPEGQNALLKLLEEPPQKTGFLLLTEKPELVLPTIRSRTGYVDLGEEDRRDEELRHRSFTLIQKIVERREEAFLARHMVDEEKDRLEDVLRYMTAYLRDVAVFHATGDMERIDNKDYGPMISEHGKYMGDKVFELYEAVLKTARYLERNVNKELAMEWLFLKFGGLKESDRQ